MRITVVCTDLGVRVPGTKGASLHLDAITRAFARTGHDVLLVGVAGHGAAPSGVECLLLPHPGRAEGWRRDLRRLRFTAHATRIALARVRAFAPDMVYERLALFGTAGRVFASATGAHHVVEVNALLAQEAAQWRSLHFARRARRCERAVLGGADVCCAVSDELAVRIQAQTGRAVDVVPNGVDARAFARLPARGSARRHFGLPDGQPVIGFTGTLRPWHGVDLAIAALAHLPGTTLAIAGDGPIRAELAAAAHRDGVADRVRFLGQVPHADVPSFLAALDVAVAPYPPLAEFAYSPLKLYEYLAAGVPVVASDIGQVRAVARAFATLVEPGDPRALARGVRLALSDPAARARAEAGRRHALAHHDWDDRARRIVDLVGEVPARALAC